MKIKSNKIGITVLQIVFIAVGIIILITQRSMWAWQVGSFAISFEWKPANSIIVLLLIILVCLQILKRRNP